MNAETKNELLRINQLFEDEKDVSYSELAFLEEHKQEVLDLGDIRLAERAGISEAEFNRGELLQDGEAICAFCGEIFDIDEMKKEVNMGYLCDSCASAIWSRGETLTFEVSTGFNY